MNHFNENRNCQGKKWLKNTLLSRFGLEGFKQIEQIIDYANNPFLSLQKISQKVKISLG